MNSYTPAVEGSMQALLELYVPDMRCAACAERIETAIHDVVPASDVTSNAARQVVRVELPVGASVDAVLEAVERAGYSPTPTRADQSERGWREVRRTHLKRIGVAGIAMMQVMMVSLATYLAGADGMDATLETVFRVSGLAFCIPVVGYAAWPFFRNAIQSVRYWSRHTATAGLAMDVPVALAIGVAFTASLYATITGSGEVYFDSVTMFTFLLLTARFAEQSLRGRLTRLDALLDLVPVQVQRIEAGRVTTVPLVDVAAGDTVRVKPGQRVPVDGVIVAGRTEIDEAVLTGEAAPRLRIASDPVYAGTLNVAQPIDVRATRAGGDTRLSSLQDLARRAEAAKPPMVVRTDAIARLFVVLVLGLAAATFLAWQWVDPDRALWVMVAVLVVSCPCALSLATPTAVTAATVALRRRGFVITQAHLLERLARATDVLIDKTGTLTTGRPELAAVEVIDSDEAQCLRAAGALEAPFQHPYAHAFANAAAATSADAVTLIPGEGIEGRLDAATWRLGTPTFCGMPALPRDDGTTELCLSRDRTPSARFRLRDTLRPDTAVTLAMLEGAGLAVHIVSGDGESATRAVAQALGAVGYHAAVPPERKLELLEQLQARGRSVLMVGDGINDVPSLAAASVSVAPLDATDLAKQRSDAFLLSRSLRPLAEAILTARRTGRVIRQNLSWAIGYNLAAIPLAMLGIIPPWLAALGMSASSLLVTLNASRLAWRRAERSAAWKA